MKGSMTNIFRQAKQLLDKKDSGADLTEEELQLINTAIIPLMVETDGIFPEDITIGEGLEKLARWVEADKIKMPGKTSRPQHHNRRSPWPKDTMAIIIIAL